MRQFFSIVAINLVLVLSLFAQNNSGEQDILKIHAGLDNAFIKKDLAFFENVWAADYVYSDPQGRMFDRSGNLAQLKKDWSDTSYKALSATTENPKVRIMGNSALLTADWTFTSQGTAMGSEPHFDRGRYTGVYEKRDGKWMLVAEHFSEAPHDRKLMEQQVMKAGLEYARIIRTQDATAIEQILADEYTFTDETGRVKNKAEDIAGYKAGDSKFEIADITDQKVRVIGNGSAVETGTFRIKGTHKGKAFDHSERYTTVWVWRGGRWQVVADHVSRLQK
jgi:ketosteroid isomerase-like protein